MTALAGFTGHTAPPLLFNKAHCHVTALMGARLFKPAANCMHYSLASQKSGGVGQ